MTHRRRLLGSLAAGALVLAGAASIPYWATGGPAPAPAPAPVVTAVAETDAVPHAGDAADDPAIWIDPDDPARSAIIGTDKQGGLAVYDLSGTQLHYYADSTPNNVDLRSGVPLAGGRTTVVVTSDTTSDSLRVYTLDPATRGLSAATARTLSTGIAPVGLCLYRSASSGALYAFASDSSGTTEQWEIFDAGSGRFDARKVRTLSLDSVVEGCAADDETGALYLSQEDVALWRCGAEPSAGSARVQVDVVGAGGHLTADIEGLAIYRARASRGYLIASSQGSDDFAVYDRAVPNAYVTRFSVAAGPAVDGVSHTDGIEVTEAALGAAFPEGLFVAQDDVNEGGGQNFKLVSWAEVARAQEPPLIIEPTPGPGAPTPGAEPGPGAPTPGAD